jgi:hypothetical protein
VIGDLIGDWCCLFVSDRGPIDHEINKALGDVACSPPER